MAGHRAEGLAGVWNDLGTSYAESYWLQQFEREVQSELLSSVIIWILLLMSDLLSSLVSRVKELCQFPSAAEEERILDGLRWIGLFSSVPATVRGGNLLDTLCAQLEKELSYRPGERDLVMLQHKFVVEWEDGNKVSHSALLAQLVLIFSGYLHLDPRALR